MILGTTWPALVALGHRGGIRSFGLRFCGGLIALLLIYVLLTIAAPLAHIDTMQFWFLASALLALISSIVGIVMRSMSSAATLLSGAALSISGLVIFLVFVNVFGPFDSAWFSFLFFG